MRLVKTSIGIAACALLLSACVAGGPDGVLSSAKDYQAAPQTVAEQITTSSTLTEPVEQAGLVESDLPEIHDQDTGLVFPPPPRGLQQGTDLTTLGAPETANNVQITSSNPVSTPGQVAGISGTPQAAFASERANFGPFLRPRNKKTYLINGLASNIEAIGYGFRNLSKKIPGSVLHNYAGPVESSTLIRSRVTRELKAAHKRDPNVEINLVGISFGANIVTIIAQELDRVGIPVNYLATLDGPAMVPIRDNVRSADNFTCTNLDCFRTTSRLAWGNKDTAFDSFKLKTSHIPLADHPQVHRRVISQINRSRTALLTAQ